MSGTSLDGVDAVLVDLSKSSPQLLASHFLAFDAALRADLMALHTPRDNELHISQLIANQLARLYALTIPPLLQHCGLTPQQIKSIGCHGQTVRHCPEHGYTLQIGNASSTRRTHRHQRGERFSQSRHRGRWSGSPTGAGLPRSCTTPSRHPSRHL